MHSVHIFFWLSRFHFAQPREETGKFGWNFYGGPRLNEPVTAPQWNFVLKQGIYIYMFKHQKSPRFIGVLSSAASVATGAVDLQCLNICGILRSTTAATLRKLSRWTCLCRDAQVLEKKNGIGKGCGVLGSMQLELTMLVLLVVVILQLVCFWNVRFTVFRLLFCKFFFWGVEKEELGRDVMLTEWWWWLMLLLMMMMMMTTMMTMMRAWISAEKTLFNWIAHQKGFWTREPLTSKLWKHVDVWMSSDFMWHAGLKRCKKCVCFNRCEKNYFWDTLGDTFEFPRWWNLVSHASIIVRNVYQCSSFHVRRKGITVVYLSTSVLHTNVRFELVCTFILKKDIPFCFWQPFTTGRRKHQSDQSK